MSLGSMMRTEVRFLYSEGRVRESLWMDPAESIAQYGGIIPSPPNATIEAIQVRYVDADEPYGEDTETGMLAKYNGNVFAFLLDSIAKGKVQL